MITPTLDVKSVRSGWADLRARVARLDAARVRAGVFDPALAVIAAVHELGSSTVPARSFVASTIREHRREIASRLAAISAAEIRSEASLEELGDLGRLVADRMRERIMTTDIPPPLKEETIVRKIREGVAYPTKPLVRTGAMVDAITWRVG